jgi:hypothetical protein
MAKQRMPLFDVITAGDAQNLEPPVRERGHAVSKSDVATVLGLGSH